jgi:hypothetical protein
MGLTRRRGGAEKKLSRERNEDMADKDVGTDQDEPMNDEENCRDFARFICLPKLDLKKEVTVKTGTVLIVDAIQNGSVLLDPFDIKRIDEEWWGRDLEHIYTRIYVNHGPRFYSSLTAQEIDRLRMAVMELNG